MRKWLVFSFQNDDDIPKLVHEGQFKSKKQAYNFALQYENERNGNRLCIILKCSKMLVINPITRRLM